MIRTVNTSFSTMRWMAVMTGLGFSVQCSGARSHTEALVSATTPGLSYLNCYER